MAIKRKGVTLTTRSQAEEVRRLTGWTRERYQREYDKLRNRVRAFEKVTGAREAGAAPINVADLLARDARARWAEKFYGEPYNPTELYKAVSAAPSISSGRNVGAVASLRIQKAAEARIENQFAGLIYNSKYSEIIQGELERLYTDPDYTPAKKLALIEQYARAMEDERRNTRAINDNISDPFKKIPFSSK